MESLPQFVQDAVTPLLQMKSLPPSVQDAVTPLLQDTVSPSVQDAVTPPLQDTVSPSDQDAVSPPLQDTVSPSDQDAGTPPLQDEATLSLAQMALSTTVMALILVASNNVLLALLFCLLDRSDLAIPPNWVLDYGTVIRIIAVKDGYLITMIHPVPVSNEARFISKEPFDEWFASSFHRHLNLLLDRAIYLVRHAYAGHNDPNASLQEAWDADLTPLGRTQALASGKAIFDDAMALGVTEIFACCSPLARTAQMVYDILQQFPLQMRPKVCLVLIEAIEHTRPIKGIHHWRQGDPLLSVAKNPFLTSEKLKRLFPEGTSPEVINRARIENEPRTKPEIASEANLMSLGPLKLDWSVYIGKMREAAAEGKPFGVAASEIDLFDVLLRLVQEQAQ